MGDLQSQGRTAFSVPISRLPGGKMPIPGNHLDNQVPWLDEARKLIGISEIPGQNDTPEIMTLYREVGHTWVDHDEVPWCAAAVGAILKRSGMEYLKSLRARDYESYGVELDGPINGCIVTFWRTSPTSGKGHVGFYGGEENGKVWVLGGNQSNSFCWKQYNKDQVTGYRWPVLAQATIQSVPQLRAPTSQRVNTPSQNPTPQPAKDRSLLDFTGRNWKTTTGAFLYLAGWVGEIIGLPLLPNDLSHSMGPTFQQTGALLAGTGVIHKLDRALRLVRPLARAAMQR